MFTRKLSTLFAFSTLSSALFAAPVNPVVAAPTVSLPVYTDTYTYDRTLPTTLAIGFTYHKDFANIYLLDESVWRVKNSRDIKEIKNWNYSDSILLKTDSWSWTQKLYNTVRKTSVRVEFSCPPNLNSPYALSVYSLPNDSSILTLYKIDGTFAFAEITHTHLYKVQDWSIYDQIVVAWNKEQNPWNFDFPFTLINVRTGEKVDCESVIYQ